MVQLADAVMPTRVAKLIVLDRDGVINYDSEHFIKSPDEWRPVPGSVEAIARLIGPFPRADPGEASGERGGSIVFGEERRHREREVGEDHGVLRKAALAQCLLAFPGQHQHRLRTDRFRRLQIA